jgi:pimeloyl-ACP methyl ester carboxylesterase
MQRFSWNWQGWPVEAVYETLGTGSPVLLLPAFSTVSSCEEMRPFASRLAVSGFACTLIDWPGFGSSTCGVAHWTMARSLYHGFLADLVAAIG